MTASIVLSRLLLLRRSQRRRSRFLEPLLPSDLLEQLRQRAHAAGRPSWRWQGGSCTASGPSEPQRIPPSNPNWQRQ